MISASAFTMKKRIFSVLLFIFLFQLSFAQLAASLSKKVDSIFLEYDKTSSPGCALAIVKNGKVIFKKGYGMSNMEYGIPIRPSSIFHVASVSKQFAAAAIIKLSLEGKLSLNDDIRKYIPEVPYFGHTITFNHLLHHTSGLRDQWVLQGLAGWRSEDLITEKDVLEMLARQKALNFVPGDEYAYSNTGYTLLGVAVKKISGVSLRKYSDSVFFKPLGMTSTHFHSDHSEIVPNRTSAYQKNENGIWKISIPVFDTYGATNLFTTVEDLAKWDENFYTNKIGGNAFVKAMQLTGVLKDDTPQTYASGLIVDTYKGYKTVSHSGADAGYRSNFLRFPNQHFSVIILANLANINARSLSNKVADLFLQNNFITPVNNDKVDTVLVKGWSGNYLDLNSKATISFLYKNKTLQVGSMILKPLNNRLFMDTTYTSTYLFSGDSLKAQLVLSERGTINKTFEKVKLITLNAVHLQKYTGDFYSSELDTKYHVSVKDSALIVTIPRRGELKLSPFVKDMFTGDLSILFSRDKADAVNGFFLTATGVRNLYFEKQEAK